MGSWTIVIHGVGSHHNQLDGDADVMAAEFADKLKLAGHNITDASFTSGGRDDLFNDNTLSRSWLHTGVKLK